MLKILTEKLIECEGGGTAVGSAPVCSAGSAMAGTDLPLGIATRRKYEDEDEFANSVVFEVEPATFAKLKEAKARKIDWALCLIEGNPDDDRLRNHKVSSAKGILLKEKYSGRLLFLKNGK